MIEVTVVLKDSERSYRKKFLCYEIISVVPEDPTIRAYIEEAKKDFQGEPEDVDIKIKMSIL